MPIHRLHLPSSATRMSLSLVVAVIVVVVAAAAPAAGRGLACLSASEDRRGQALDSGRRGRVA